ncbi:hypothetical protein LG290_09820 [Halomonas sediminis]
MLPPPGPSRIVFSIALSMALLGFLIAAGLLWVDRNARVETTETWLERIQEDTTAAAESLDQNLRNMAELGDELAAELSSGELSVKAVDERLENLVKEHPHVFGAGVIFRPFAYDPNQRLYSRYLVRRDDAYRMLQIEDLYDYSQPQHEWFQQGIKQSGWIEPFYGEASQAMLALYCTPFSLPQQQPIREDTPSDGTVCIDYSIEDVWSLVSALDLGQTGYAIAMTDQGTLVAHPRREYVRQGQSLFDLAETRQDSDLRRLAEQATAQRSGILTHSNSLTGQFSWIFYEPIPATNWSLAVVAFRDEIPLDISEHKYRQIGTTIFLVIGGIGLMGLAASYQLDSKPTLWGASVGITLLFLLGIINIWRIEFSETNRDPPEAVMLVDSAGIESYLSDYDKTAQQQQFATPIKIPTGVFVQAINFDTPHDPVVSGFVWQRYRVPEHDDLSRGIFFPDAVPDYDIREELYRFREGDTEVVGWFFKTTLHQPFDYSGFPIDVKTVRLRIWHPSIERNVILVPELEAYRLIHPTSQPGMETDFHLPGWKVQRSFFAYRFHNYRSDFGIRGSAISRSFPELTYNVTLLRNITDAFVSNQIPLFVAAFMLFAMLVIDTRKKSQALLHGFTTSTVLGTAAAIFFIILLAHIDIRRRYVAEQIMYLEYFYFITYFSILAISFNAFMLTATSHNHFFHYRDNLIPKLLFWPLLHGAFFVVTVYVFL